MSATRTPAQQARELRESLRRARELADALVAQADRVRAQCQQLEDALGTVDALGAREAETQVTAEEPAVRDPVEPARLAAMEMALQGRSQDEIMEYLRRSLDEDKARQVLAGVFDQQ
jgi:hypothetical protein